MFVDGKLDRTLRGDGLVDEFIGILEAYVERRYPATRSSPVGGAVIRDSALTFACRDASTTVDGSQSLRHA